MGCDDLNVHDSMSYAYPRRKASHIMLFYVVLLCYICVMVSRRAIANVAISIPAITNIGICD